MFRFEKLDIWKLAIDYVNDVYELAETFPVKERYNMVDQLRRAALSISNNIAEGSGVSTNKNFSSFLDISISSALETVNILYMARKREYISEQDRLVLYQKAETLIKKICAFKKSLK